MKSNYRSILTFYLSFSLKGQLNQGGNQFWESHFVEMMVVYIDGSLHSLSLSRSLPPSLSRSLSLALCLSLARFANTLRKLARFANTLRKSWWIVLWLQFMDQQGSLNGNMIQRQTNWNQNIKRDIEKR